MLYVTKRNLKAPSCPVTRMCNGERDLALCILLLVHYVLHLWINKHTEEKGNVRWKFGCQSLQDALVDMPVVFHHHVSSSSHPIPLPSRKRVARSQVVMVGLPRGAGPPSLLVVAASIGSVCCTFKVQCTTHCPLTNVTEPFFRV
jgi:hypothetical protein